MLSRCAHRGGREGHHAKLGVSIKRLLTDNGPAFRSKEFANVCIHLGIEHKFTRAYTP